MQFKENNKIRYGQDFAIWQGIPAGVDFTVTRFGNQEEGRFVLTGPGYGKPGNYGNGRLYVFGLSKKQIKKFEKALAE